MEPELKWDLKWYQDGNAGIYIHIPFCIKKCRYCDFFSVTDLSLRNRFVHALETEILLSSDPQLPCDTLYLGGGTPSVLEIDQIRSILESCFMHFHLLPDAEITMEVNPGTVNKTVLKEYKSVGINRLSIGIQSFQSQGLNFLGRIHSADDAIDTVKAAIHAGFENISLDLIYGIPDTTLTYWKSDLEKAIQFQPGHLSCYMLSFEPGTQLFADLQTGMVHPVSEKESCMLFETTRHILEDSGYMPYEVSNFARSPAKYSRHNMKYWTFMPYIGLGPAAHSFTNNQRRWNKKSITEYLKDLDNGLLPVEKKEVLTVEQQIIEALYLGFRQTAGMDISWFNKTFSRDFNKMFADAIHTFSQKGYVSISDRKCRLTKKGMVLLDSIVDAFVTAV